MRHSGSSGIREKWGSGLVDAVRDTALSLSERYGKIALASDFRETSDSLRSLMAGYLMAGGTEVYDAGKVPTPTLAYAGKDTDAAVMITASHNPAEYNGIKLWNPDGSAFSTEQMELLEGGSIAEWNRTGRLHSMDALSMHASAIMKRARPLDGLKVVLDCSNGAGSVITPHILSELGASIMTLNCHPDGIFPGHPSEPSEENLSLLRETVLKQGADIGMAHDGDADRFIAISPSGRYIDGDRIMALFIRHYGFKKVVAPVNSSMLLDRYAEVKRCRVGDANVSEMLKSGGYEFGGEQSGTQIFPDWRYTPDAIYSAVMFAGIAVERDIEEMLSGFPEYFTLRRSIRYVERSAMEERVRSFVSGYEAETLDGWRVDLGDSWFLIRFSGTEPKLRVSVESVDERRAKEVMDMVMKGLGVDE